MIIDADVDDLSSDSNFVNGGAHRKAVTVVGNRCAVFARCGVSPTLWQVGHAQGQVWFFLFVVSWVGVLASWVGLLHGPSHRGGCRSNIAEARRAAQEQPVSAQINDMEKFTLQVLASPNSIWPLWKMHKQDPCSRVVEKISRSVDKGSTVADDSAAMSRQWSNGTASQEEQKSNP